MSDKTFKKTEQSLSPWVTLVTRISGEDPKPFHSLKLDDYINAIALTPKQELVLVRQYRITQEKWTLELPGGLLEKNETPLTRAEIELREETGYIGSKKTELLGSFNTDFGRLENRIWGFYFENVVKITQWNPEPDVETILLPLDQLKKTILNNEFEHALHVALLFLAQMHGKIKI